MRAQTLSCCLLVHLFLHSFRLSVISSFRGVCPWTSLKVIREGPEDWEPLHKALDSWETIFGGCLVDGIPQCRCEPRAETLCSQLGGT